MDLDATFTPDVKYMCQWDREGEGGGGGGESLQFNMQVTKLRIKV